MGAVKKNLGRVRASAVRPLRRPASVRGTATVRCLAFLLLTSLLASLATTRIALARGDAAPLSYPRAVTEFERAMRDPDPGTRIEAARAFARVHDPRTVRAIARQAQEECRRHDALEREHESGLATLRRMERADARAHELGRAPRYGDAEQQRLRSRIDAVRAEWLATERVLCGLADAVGACLAGLDDDSFAKALVELTREGFERGEAAEQCACVQMLASSEDPRARSVLAAILESGESAPARVLAALALAGAREPAESCADALVAALDDPSWQVRAAAIEGLERFRSPRVVSALIEALAREEGRLREDIAGILRAATGQDFSSDPAKWRAWWSEAGAEADALLPSATADRAADPSIPRSRDRYAASFYGIETRSRRLVFVLDTSGSMNEESESARGTKLAIAKRELTETLQGLVPPARFNLVFFGDTVRAWKPDLVELDDRTREEAIRFLENERASGGTNLFGGLRAAFRIRGLDALEAPEDHASADTVFLLTDGEPTRGDLVDPREILEEVTRWNRTRRVRIHAIGLGAAHNRELLEALSERTGGRYVFRR